MSDGRPKPAIPAWQRTALPRPAATEDPVYSRPEKSQTGQVADTSQDASASEEPESAPSSDASPATAPTAEAGETEVAAFGTADFESFKQQQPATRGPPPQQAQQAPPIITYPEFLVEAHKPPPLITPTRIANALYLAGSVTAVLYGASRWIIKPMMENLTEARHDFLSHSQTKVDEFNDRLSEIVSKVPEGKKEVQMPEQDIEDADSEMSDPTELYHRDMGTQTSPLPSRRPSVPDLSIQTKDPVAYQTGALEMLRDYVKDMIEGVEKTAEANKDRQDTMNKFRNNLDSIIYGNPGALWQTSDDAVAMKFGATSKDDSIEELKREIRGVKGILLSSKRFPAANRAVAGAA